MLAGICFQVVVLIVFFAACADLAVRIRRASEVDYNPDFVEVRRGSFFKGFLAALGFASLAIFIRSVFRIAELREGFDGPLAQDENSFMVLEGAMISVAVLLLTIWHPGIAFQRQWSNAGWTLRKGRQAHQSGPEKDTEAQEAM